MIYTNENWEPPVTYCEPNKEENKRLKSDRPKGKWGNISFGGLKTCSNCGYICTPILEYQTQDIYNFCPNCGADMRGVKHEAD